MKKCSRCQEVKDDTAFCKNKAQRDGLSNNCRACVKLYVAERGYEQVRADARAWAKTPLGRQRGREKMQTKRQKIREAIFDHYGRKCVCCGDTHVEFLTIDHMNDDGAEHRRALLANRGAASKHRQNHGIANHLVAADIVKNNFPDTFQILCFNCNWAKYRYGTCPHQVEGI